MTPSQLRRREALLARNDAALDRWPQRTGQEFMREMAAVVEGLETLARESDAAQGDRLERSRNWRYVGNAYFDLANAKDLPLLRRAADAYQKAEAQLAGIDNAVERMKLDYSYGHALFHLSDAKDLTLVQEARRRYASALQTARAELPAAVESATTALANADRVLALLTQAEALSGRIAELKGQINAMDAEGTAEPEPVPDFPALFQQLLGVYQQDVAAGKVSETKQKALEAVLAPLGEIVSSGRKDVAGLTTNLSRVLDLAGGMLHVQATSQDASTLPAGSRAGAVWKRFAGLKAALSRDVMVQRGGEETQFTGLEIFKRCGYAYTFLHQPGRDDDTVLAYEADVLRQVACEVRAFALRNHFSLASPAWPSSPMPLDPNAVFFSGGTGLRRPLAEICAKRRLKLLAQAAPKDYATTRWDQLRACHVALFDFTGYVRPDPDRPVDLTGTGPIAAVSYELGIALTLGRAVIVVANEGQDLPFDVDIEPVWLRGDDQDGERLADAIDDAMYGLQRAGEESSIAATHAYLKERLAGTQNAIVEMSLKLIDGEVARDPVKFRRFVEPVLGRAGPDAPQMIVSPAWPGSYPRPGRRRCFHVTPFGPAWARETTTIVAAACKKTAPHIEYVRGDRVLDPNITRSIWDNLCQASHVVVDLTGLNANVVLELGMAHTLGRNVLLVTQDTIQKGCFPSIAKVRVHRYSMSGAPGLEPLRQALETFMAS